MPIWGIQLGAILFDYVQSGKIRCLAASPVRLCQASDIPTLREQGWDQRSIPDVRGLAAPKGLPDEVLQRLEAALDDLKRDKAFSGFAVEKLRMRPVEFGMAHAAQYMEEASKRYAAQAAR